MTQRFAFPTTGFAEKMESEGLAKTYEESGWCEAPADQSRRA